MALVIIAGCDDPVGRALATELAGTAALTMACFPTLESAMQSVEGKNPSVVVVCPSVDAADGIALAASLRKRDSDTATLLVTPHPDAGLLRAALKAGVRDVLTEDDGPKAIAAAVLEADEAVVRRRAVEEGRGAEVAASPRRGTVVTVFSTKGGVGKSVLATNLSVALAHDLKKSTILIDLDLQFGDVSVMLQLPPERTIFDAAQAFDRLDAEMLSGFLVKHDSGLLALLAPVRPEEAESVTTSRIAQIIALTRTLADFVVVDTPAALSEVVLTALEQSDLVLAVATLDVPSVKNTKVSLQKLHQLGFDGSMVRLVLNRADSKVWLEPHEIEKAIADRIVARIPSDRLVPRSVNKGVPVVLDSPHSAVARSMLALAREVAAS
jgi:pilus assembly protein CpaE